MTSDVTMTEDDAALPDLRRMPLPDALRWLRDNGEPADPRPGIDTESLRRRFPRLKDVVIRDLDIETPHGRQPARLYRDEVTDASGRALVWVHGGAFLGGHLDMPESNWVSLELAARGIPVLALDYTKCLGDTHFPVPSDDVLAGWRNARDHAEELFGADARRLALGGGSAGGNLVAGVAARLRDSDEGVPPELVLVYPVLHPDGTDPGRTPQEAATTAPLSLNFAGSVDILGDPHAFVGLGPVEGFPPTLVVVCEHDGLRPSGEAFARALDDAGAEVTLHLEPDADHGHIDEPSDPTAIRTIEAIAAWLQR